MSDAEKLRKLADWLDLLEFCGHFEARPADDPVTTEDIRVIASRLEALENSITSKSGTYDSSWPPEDFNVKQAVETSDE